MKWPGLVAALAFWTWGVANVSTAAELERPTAEKPEPRVFVPDGRLKGSTEGTTQLQVSVGYQTALDESWDNQVRLRYEIGTSDGLATLFDPDSDELGASAPWSIGISFSLMKLSTRYTDKEKLEDANIKATAWCLCEQQCSSQDGGDKDFCAYEEKSSVPEDICEIKLQKPPTCEPGNDKHPFCVGIKKFCKAGIEHIKKATPQARYVSHPHKVLNVGASGGRDEFKFLASKGGTPSTLTPGTKVAASWRAGASGVLLKPLENSWVSYEALAFFESSLEASTNKARWCAPKGNVEQDGVVIPAEECKDSVIGEPAQVQTLTGAFYIGNVDQKTNTYRVSPGLRAEVPLNSQAKDDFRLSFSMPVYINLTSGNEGYKGIVRIVPSVTIANKRGGGSDTTFGISLALLGQRQLFTREFDEL